MGAACPNDAGFAQRLGKPEHRSGEKCYDGRSIYIRRCSGDLRAKIEPVALSRQQILLVTIGELQ
jgi:hypothetical protein